MDEITPRPLPRAAARAVANRIETKAMQTLMGMVTGVVADAHLHDKEILLLNTWLTEHAEMATQWPGCAIAHQIRSVLADGIITDDERTHLLSSLSELANSDFAATGSTQAEPIALPIDDQANVNMFNAGIVHTGTFMFGTRAQCERLSMAMGAMPLDTVSRRTDVVVIGTRVSPSWVNESYGRKILRAAELRDSGCPIRIISERFWFQHAQAAGKA